MASDTYVCRDMDNGSLGLDEVGQALVGQEQSSAKFGHIIAKIH